MTGVSYMYIHSFNIEVVVVAVIVVVVVRRGGGRLLSLGVEVRTGSAPFIRHPAHVLDAGVGTHQ